MKIKIITIHAMHNPGSVFQAYALQKYLQQNHDTQIIDYRPNYFYHEHSKIKYLIKKVLYGKKYRNRKKKFDDFIIKNMNLTSPFLNYRELENEKMEADIFITGSDQLWNSDFPCGNDEAFYLKFVDKGRKISYSTSVGKAKIDLKNDRILKKELPAFDSLSVREKSTAAYLTKILKRDVCWVCDPVFLLCKEEYKRFIHDDFKKYGKYVVVYLSEASDKLDSIVRHLKKCGYMIILAGGFTRRCECDLHIMDVGPEEFLSLIYYAECVVSSSFHATAFCHIFHKNFITLLPETNGDRILSLLSVSNLENRAVKDDINWERIERKIEWEYADEKIKKYIEVSKKYLEDAIKEKK